jgi:hypothetical protein
MEPMELEELVQNLQSALSVWTGDKAVFSAAHRYCSLYFS